jgi:hypothetical protein
MNDILKSILLQLGIAGLKALIPTLGGLLGGPLGWIASFAVSWLSNLLIKWVEKLGIINKNAERAKEISDATTVATIEWQKAATDTTLSKEQKAIVYEKFKDAHRAIKFGSVQSVKN